MTELIMMGVTGLAIGVITSFILSRPERRLAKLDGIELGVHLTQHALGACQFLDACHHRHDPSPCLSCLAKCEAAQALADSLTGDSTEDYATALERLVL